MSQHRNAVFVLAVCVALAIGGWSRHRALDAGFWADDYAQLAMLERTYPNKRAAWDLFRFFDDRQEDHQQLLDFGAIPWWAHPHFRLSMLRPLPSLTVALDHSLYQFDPQPMHVHSLVWWAVLVVLVGLVLFKVAPPLTAAIALLLFSVDESQTVPVLWLANRSALMATAFAMAALLAHLCWRDDPAHKLWRGVSVGLYAAALGCGEYAFASLGYIVCVELVRRTPGISRARALMPFIALAAAFFLISSFCGYGTAHSALYTSPISAPFDYAMKVVTGLPVLLADLVLGIPADWWSFGSPWPQELRTALSISPDAWEQLPSWKSCQLLLGVLSGLVTFALIRWLKGRISDGQRSSLIGLIGGACLGILPTLGSFITTRLALPAAFAFAALFATVLVAAAERVRSLLQCSTSVRSLASRFGLALCVFLLVYVHGYRAYRLTADSTSFYVLIAQSRSRWPLTAALDPRGASHQSQQRLVMIASADANDSAYTPFVRAAFGWPMLHGLRLLSGAPGAHAITRVDAQTLDVRIMDDFGLSASVANSLTRGASEGLSSGEKFHVAGMDVTVLQTHSGQPTYMRFRFDVPLESETLAFVHSTARGLERLSLPTLGDTLQLPPPIMPNLAYLSAP